MVKGAKHLEQVSVAQWSGKHVIYLPLYVAEKLGFFRETGLDVSIYAAGNDNEIFAEVAAGHADFGVGDPAFVAIGAGKNVHAKVVAALINNVCMWGLTHHAEIRQMHEASDFAGLRFGSFPRPSTTFAVIDGIRRRDSRISKTMEIVEAPIGEQLSLLSSGRADVVIEVEPMVSFAEENGLRIVLSMAEFYRDFLLTGVMASQDTIDRRPEMVQKFVSALQRGLSLCHREPAEALGVASTLFPALSKSCLQSAIQRMCQSRAWPEQVMMQTSAWQAALQLRRDIGDLQALSDSNNLLDQRFAYRAVTGL